MIYRHASPVQAHSPKAEEKLGGLPALSFSGSSISQSQKFKFISQSLGYSCIGFLRRNAQQDLAQKSQCQVVGLVQAACVGDDHTEEQRQNGAQAGQGNCAAL